VEKFIKVSRIPDNAENVLELETPERYSCRVWRYAAGHSRLAIALNQDDANSYDPIYAIFEAVDYFEGIMSWKGANLKAASREESIKQKMNIQGTPIAKLPELPYTLPMRLFTFDAANVQIKILASLLTLTDDISSLP
jgi:hypothetical protein